MNWYEINLYRFCWVRRTKATCLDGRLRITLPRTSRRSYLFFFWEGKNPGSRNQMYINVYKCTVVPKSDGFWWPVIFLWLDFCHLFGSMRQHLQICFFFSKQSIRNSIVDPNDLHTMPPSLAQSMVDLAAHLQLKLPSGTLTTSSCQRLVATSLLRR